MEYEIIYSKRRTVSLCVRDSRLIVRAPIGTPDARIRELVKSHSQWIERALIKQEKPRIKDAEAFQKYYKKLKIMLAFWLYFYYNYSARKFLP